MLEEQKEFDGMNKDHPGKADPKHGEEEHHSGEMVENPRRPMTLERMNVAAPRIPRVAKGHSARVTRSRSAGCSGKNEGT